MIRFTSSLKKLRRGIYQVYFVNPRRRQKAVPIYFDLAALLTLFSLAALYFAS